MWGAPRTPSHLLPDTSSFSFSDSLVGCWDGGGARTGKDAGQKHPFAILSLRSYSWPITDSEPPTRTTTSGGLFSSAALWVGSSLKGFNFPVANDCSQWLEEKQQPGTRRTPSACLEATAHTVATSIPTWKGTGPKPSQSLSNLSSSYLRSVFRGHCTGELQPSCL